MAYGVWNNYPWGSSSAQTVQLNYDNSTWDYNSGVYYYTTGSNPYQYSWPSAQQIAEKVEPMVEGAMDWLKRRVTEITDLAYAEV